MIFYRVCFIMENVMYSKVLVILLSVDLYRPVFLCCDITEHHYMFIRNEQHDRFYKTERERLTPPEHHRRTLCCYILSFLVSSVFVRFFLFFTMVVS